MMYPLTLLDDRVERPALIEHLENHGVETRYLLPLINQPIYRATFGNLDAEYPVAARLNERAFYVGSHPDMSDEDADHIIAALRSFVGGHP
jgi:dTDP-4-amino-4,6-dideoxygalactose transaminase